MQKIKPFLKWAGNKYRSLEIILKHLKPANRLVEPFTGSGSVFLNTVFSNYLLAEENEDLVNLFKLVQKEGALFINYCEQLFSQENNCEKRYYQFRNEFNTSQDNYHKAALFLYLNRHGYNGLCRYNQKKIYNVPFGRYIKPYFPRNEMNYFHEKSQQAQFVISDFRQTFSEATAGDIIYCDPPYVPVSPTAYFVSYTHKRFNETDQIDLANLALKSAKKGIPVIISNHDTAFTRECYREANIISFPVFRPISCHSQTRKPIQELLAIFNT